MTNDKTIKQQNAIAIFGGSFDPVTNAHVGIINNLADSFSKVIVVPSFVSPFKKQGSVASASDRLAMLVGAGLLDRSNIEISDFEILQEGTSYTIDTIRHFKKQYKNAPLYFVIGSEMLKKLPKWHEFVALKTLVTFLCIQRQDFPVATALVKRLTKKLEVNLEFADFKPLNEASSTAKIDIAFKNFKNIPKPVADYIKKNNLYNDFDFITSRYQKFALSDKRIKHIYGTAIAAVNLAKKHNANIYDISVAALLHDITKTTSIETVKNLGVVLSGIPSEYPDKVAHAFTGADVAKQIFGIKKKGILDAIRFHTTGSTTMSKLAKILFIADFSEENRDGELYEEERAFVREEKNLNKAVLKILETKIKHVEGKGKEVYYLTSDAFSFFTAKLAPKIKADLLVNQAIEDCDALTQLQNENAELNLKAEQMGELKVKALKVAEAEEIFAERPKTIPLTMPAKVAKPIDKNHLAYKIAKILDDKKGRDITLIDIAEKTIIADFFVIASAFSTTAVRALTDIVDEELSKKMGIEPLRRDIDPSWACVDYGSVILHVQLEETRDFYNLERLWSNGENVERF